jgi:hypothetical protein
MTNLAADQVRNYTYLPQNLLANGGFEIWQRGAGPFVGIPSEWTADEWYAYASGTAFNVQRSTSPHTGVYAAQMSSTVGVELHQEVENYRALSGRDVTFSCWVKTSGVARLYIYDHTDAGWDSVYYGKTGTGSWEQLTVTKTLRVGLSNDTGSSKHGYGLRVSIYSLSGAQVEIDSAMLVVGNFPDGVPFVPMNPADEWSRCQRFYEVGQVRASGYCDFNAGVAGNIQYSSRKSANPTVTTSLLGGSNTGTDTVQNNSEDGFVLKMYAAAGTGVFASGNYSWDAEVS